MTLKSNYGCLVVCFLFISSISTAQNLPFVLNCDRPPQNRNLCDSLNARGGLEGQNEFCENQEVIFVNNTPQLVDSTIYCWGDGTYSIESGKNNGKHKYNFPRDTCLKENNGIIELEIKMIVFKRCPNGYSVNRITTPVLIRLRPKIELQIPDPVCENVEFTIRNSSCGNDVASSIKCSYVFGNGAVNNGCGSTITYKYPQAGTYPFQYTLSNRCGERSFSQTINVIGLPKAIAKIKPDTAPSRKSFIICLQGGGVVNLSGEASKNSSSYVWSTSASTGITWFTRKDTITPMIQFTKDGSYTLILKADNSCSKPSFDTLLFKVVSAQALSLNAQPDACVPLDLYKPSPIVVGAKYFFNGNLFNPNTGIRADLGQHIVVATLENECGNQERRDTFSIIESVPVKITSDRGKTICVNTSVTLSANVEGGRWQGQDISPAGIFIPKTEGRFTLTYARGTGDCEKKDTIIYVVVKAENLTLNPQTDECAVFKYQPKPFLSNAVYFLDGAIFNGADGIQAGLGVHNVLVTLENACGKQEMRDTFSVTPAEVLKINTARGQSICTNKSINLDVTPVGGTWSGQSVTPNGVFTAQTAGAFTLTYTLGSGSCLQKDTISFTVIGSVSLSLDDQIDQCLPFKFRPSPIISEAVYTMDGTIFNANDGVDVAVGTHKIEASLKNLCDSSKISKTFKVTGLPMIDLMMADTVACFQGSSLILKATASTNDGRWSGQGVERDSFIPNKAGFGLHTLTYTAGGTGCEANRSIKVKVIGVEVKTGVNDLKICDPDRATVTPLSGGTPANGQYRLGSPTGEILTKITPSVLGVGTHRIYYVIIDSTTSSLACPSYAYFTVSIYGRPTGGIQGDSAKCTNTPLSINANGGDTYDWDLGEGTTKQGSTITHSYTQAGNYKVRLIVVSDAGCRDTLFKSIKIVAPADAIPSPKDTIICHGSSVQYRIVSGKAESFTWLRDGEEVAKGIQPQPIIFENLEQNNKTYRMSLSMGVSVCPNQTQTMTVTVRPKVKAIISASKSRVCSNESVQFAPNLSRGHISRWQWDLGNGTISRDSLPSKMVYQTDTAVRLITIRLMVEDTLCAKDTTSIQIEVIPLSTRAFMNVEQTRVCQGVPTRFINQSSRFSKITWNFGDFTPNSSDSIAYHIFKQPGIYTVTLYAYSDCGGFDTVKQAITVLAAPILKGLSYDIADKCFQTKVRLWARLGSSILPNIEWHLGDSSVRREDTITYQYAKGGDYWVKAIVISAQTQCPATDSIKITLKDPLRLDIQSIRWDSCGNSEGIISLKATNGFLPLRYAMDTINWTETSIFANLKGEKRYNFYVQDAQKCSAQATADLKGRMPLSVQLGKDLDINMCDSVRLQATINVSNRMIQKINWSINRNCLTPDCSAIIARPAKTTLYKVTVTDTLNCISIDSILVNVNEKWGFYDPNVFSPNGDGHDDVFYLQGNDCAIVKIKSFRIITEWGNVVYEQFNIPINQADVGWNGKFGDTPMGAGVYKWFAKLELFNGDIILKNGNVTLHK